MLEGCLLEIPLWFGVRGGESLCCLSLWFSGVGKGSPSTDWMRPTHIPKGSLRHSKSWQEHSNNVWQTSGHQNPGKLTHKINYHSGWLMLPGLLLGQPHELVISNPIFHRACKHPVWSCTAGKQQRQELKSFWYQTLVVSKLHVLIYFCMRTNLRTIKTFTGFIFSSWRKITWLNLMEKMYFKV